MSPSAGSIPQLMDVQHTIRCPRGHGALETRPQNSSALRRVCQLQALRPRPTPLLHPQPARRYGGGSSPALSLAPVGRPNASSLAGRRMTTLRCGARVLPRGSKPRTRQGKQDFGNPPRLHQRVRSCFKPTSGDEPAVQTSRKSTESRRACQAASAIYNLGRQQELGTMAL